MTLTIYIDGAEGTTGLQLKQRLLSHSEVKILDTDISKRKDINYKLEKFSNADLIFLCLPDKEAEETVFEIEKNISSKKVIIDASSAHRVSKGWEYGFPELHSNKRKLIKGSNRITNPGCYPTGALSLIRPLIESNIIGKSSLLTINAISGYTGGGKKLVNFFSTNSKEKFFYYSTFLDHKHNKEIKKYSLLDKSPIFCPSVGAFPQGMAVSVPIHFDWFQNKIKGKDIFDLLHDNYNSDPLISVNSLNSESQLTAQGFLSPEVLIGTNNIDISIFSNDKLGQLWLVARLDNLGKGASGAAIQNMNIRFGFDENLGVNIKNEFS